MISHKNKHSNLAGRQKIQEEGEMLQRKFGRREKYQVKNRQMVNLTAWLDGSSLSGDGMVDFYV